MAVDNSAVRDENFMAKPRLKKIFKKNRRGGEKFHETDNLGRKPRPKYFCRQNLGKIRDEKNEPQK